MAELRTRWLTFYAANVEPVYKEIVSHIEKVIIGTLIVSAGAHMSSEEPAIQLFGYLRHGLVGRGVMLVGIIVLLLNFVDGLTKLAKVNWHAAWQIVMSLFYIAQSNLEQTASFSVSGSTVSGLLLFLWDGGTPLAD